MHKVIRFLCGVIFKRERLLEKKTLFSFSSEGVLPTMCHNKSSDLCFNTSCWNWEGIPCSQCLPSLGPGIPTFRTLYFYFSGDFTSPLSLKGESCHLTISVRGQRSGERISTYSLYRLSARSPNFGLLPHLCFLGFLLPSLGFSGIEHSGLACFLLQALWLDPPYPHLIIYRSSKSSSFQFHILCSWRCYKCLPVS